jgi:hypothetical protein
MGTVEEILKAVKQLSPEEQAKFRALYEEFDAAVFDAKLERDSLAGKFDAMAEQAIEDYRAGRSRKL